MINAVHTFEELAIKIDGWTVGYCQSVTADMFLTRDTTVLVQIITVQTDERDGPALTLDLILPDTDSNKGLMMLWALLAPEIKRRALIECREFVRHLENARVYNEDDEHRLAKNQII